MIERVFQYACLLFACVSVADGDPGDVFKVDGQPPARVMFTLGEDPVSTIDADTEMGRIRSGVLGQMTGYARLTRLVERDTRPRPTVQIDTRVCVAWLYGPTDRTSDDQNPVVKRVEIGTTEDGWLLARELDLEDDQLDMARLDDEGFRKLSSEWGRFRGSYGQPPEDPPGMLVEILHPYTQSSIILDSAVLRRRIYGRDPTDVAPLDRNLDEERMFLRLPVGYDPSRPAGILIWINAGDSGLQPLDVFAPALDELGLICASVENAGNSREIVDRLQLMLDCLETVASRYLVDDERVYVTGISGGGRSSSILWGCFPDVFTGAVPIVGLNSYKLAPTGTGRAWPKNFMKPRGRGWSQLKKHRLAAITGRNDFNEREMKVRIADMIKDGLDVRLVDQPEMGHEMPKPETFAAALSWVDEPARLAAQKRSQKARSLLERATTLPDGSQLLVRVMEIAPWSDEAFEAMRLLEAEE